MIDWNDGSVRETARFIVDASHEMQGAAAQFAPGDEAAFLAAMVDAMECGNDGCYCGGELPDHWPKPFPNRCAYHQHCPCGGSYHTGGGKLVLDYGTA